jgi:hypothetical protein
MPEDGIGIRLPMSARAAFSEWITLSLSNLFSAI